VGIRVDQTGKGLVAEHRLPDARRPLVLGHVPTHVITRELLYVQVEHLSQADENRVVVDRAPPAFDLAEPALRASDQTGYHHLGESAPPTLTGDPLSDLCASVHGPCPSSRSTRSEEHTSELQSRENLVCRL